MKFTSMAALAFAALALPQAQAASSDIAAHTWDQVLQGSWRAPENSVRDTYRHPRETLTFFGLKANQKVIEITPGGGWYSEVLAPLLKDHGQYIAALQAPASGDYFKKAAAGLKQKFAADPARYAKATSVEFDPKAPRFGAPNSVDSVFTFRNVHNWVMADTAPAMFKGFYSVLKHGGTLGVVDHRGKPGESVDEIKQSGYLPTDYVIKLATDAGFKLAGQSEVNANARDTKDYPQGVWTLPPVLREGDKDRAKYVAIGESDRMTLRFVKP
ncbi:MAG: methyltransferase [Pseudomonas sp.]|nr:methyltransferase [Pseudomonas sp.]